MFFSSFDLHLGNFLICFIMFSLVHSLSVFIMHLVLWSIIRLLLRGSLCIEFCSGGMNGYLSLCNGDPCPPVFRSPIKGLEDIMDNQVICAIYKFPDAHKHLTQPPSGVVFPKKVFIDVDMCQHYCLFSQLCSPSFCLVLLP
ncbi:5'-3' exoribonuclease 3 [Dendrobium catenatum]|uniref:5'-3' exoribonuclease 3 n=1 Tax=Dendrobium catenatum TaxID=906689 RepID=A0A2I0VFE1_9ASPA|nr:5'-3' exoribonuclease 3 [Dendrobium catenatum]